MDEDFVAGPRTKMTTMDDESTLNLKVTLHCITQHVAMSYPRPLARNKAVFDVGNSNRWTRRDAAGPKKVLLATKPYFSKKHITKYMMPPATLLPRTQ